jgi:ABC-type multidrug transport system fused ATPase/permease subunit
MRFVAADFEDEKKAKKNLFIMVAVIAAIVGVLMTIVLQSLLIVLIIIGIMVVVAIPAFLVPVFRYRKLKSSEAEALIAENGVIVGKMFHLWVKLGARLDGVSLNTAEEPDIIEFNYSMPTRNGRQEEVARVPVPFGKLEEATRIVEHFKNKINT